MAACDGRPEALPADLRWQREALLRVARRSLLGCDERAWPAAAPAACALAVALEGAPHILNSLSRMWSFAIA